MVSRWSGTSSAAVSIDRFPSRVPLDSLPAWGVLEPMFVGVEEQHLQPAALRVRDGDHLFVAGPPRSGRSNVLALIATGLDEARHRTGFDLGLIVVSAGREQLRAPSDLAVDADIATVATAIEEADPSRRWVVLIDDAEDLADPDEIVEGLMSRRDRSVNVVMAMGADAARASFGHPSRRVRRSRLGVLLCPDADLDGDLLGVRLPRRVAIPWLPGRGYLVEGGSLSLVQMAMNEGL